MSNAGIAKLFMNGRSQAVRLPQEFRFTGDQVRVRRVGQAVILEPMLTDVQKWFGEIDLCATAPFPAGWRNQPITPERDIFE